MRRHFAPFCVRMCTVLFGVHDLYFAPSCGILLIWRNVPTRGGCVCVFVIAFLYVGVFFLFFSQTSSDGNTTTSILTFIPGKEDAGKHLSCKSENQYVNKEVLETGWKLEINCKYKNKPTNFFNRYSRKDISIFLFRNM